MCQWWLKLTVRKINIYHNIPNHSEAHNNNTKYHWGSPNVIGNLRIRVACILVHRKIILNVANIVDWRQKFKVLTAAGEIEILYICYIEYQLRCFYYFCRDNIILDTVARIVNKICCRYCLITATTAHPPIPIKNKWKNLITDV